MNWLVFALMTVVSWGVYGIFLHSGQMNMKPPGGAGTDPSIWRYKAFLFVGVAYFLVAILAPLLLLMQKGVAFSGYTSKGIWWSLAAGIVGAVGAFCVLLAFGQKGGTPSVVMSIVFAGAPIVNAVVAILQHPPEGGFSVIKPQFFLGILLAATGGCLVTLYKPNPPAPKPPPTVTQTAASAR